MFIEKVLYDLDDLTIIPAIQSDIRHRGDLNSFYDIDGEKYLPVFVSPMECVINKDNFDVYKQNKVIPMLPRTESLETRIEYSLNGEWSAYGLEEFKNAFCQKNHNYSGKKIKALIDNANGHMSELPAAIRKAKALSKAGEYEIIIMAGNIAHPETYRVLAEAGADYVRCAVGTGNCCITASNTATYYPMGSLILDSRAIKEKYNLDAKIVADGGISTYNRAIKAYAAGADFVMIGSTFGRCFESASEFISVDKPIKAYTYYTLNEINDMRLDNSVGEDEKKDVIKMYAPMTKAVWGMSTRRAQTSIALAQGKKKGEIETKTSEGVEKIVTVDYTLHQWLENFNDYLKSSMSYCNITDINDYVGGPIVMISSEAAKRAINK